MKKLLLSIGLIGTTGFVSAQAPVAYYPFNGNANDESGNGYHGTVAGATLTTDRFGNANSAYEFHGGNGIDSINCGYIPELDSAVSYTISCWLNQNVLDVRGGVWNFSNPAGSQYIQTRTWDNGEMYSYQQAFDSYDYSQSVTAGMWFHFAYVFDFSITQKMKMYINGVEVSSFTGGNIRNQDTTASLCIGSDYYEYVNSDSWDGKIDDFVVYGQALTPTQIDSLYNAPNPTSVDDLDNSKMTLYPNPTNSFLTINSESRNLKYINIIDITGKTVKTLPFTERKIDTSGLSDGVYFLQVGNEEGMITSRFVKN